MLDPKILRNDPESVKKGLKSRGADISLADKFIEADEAWRKATVEFETLKNHQNEVSAKIAKLKREGKDGADLLEEMKGAAQKLKTMSSELSALEAAVKNIHLIIPNIPNKKTPEGKDSSSNVEIRKWGNMRKFDFTPKPHDEIGEKLGIFDFKQAAKISGARFVVLHGLGARLEMALINFMLDLHTRNGYSPVLAPYLVNGDSMRGTGQLPKFSEDLYQIKSEEESGEDLYLIPTAEVSITNLHKDEILPLEKLPIKYASYSACFRSEAGSYGKDVKGIIRQHQFNKVELVKFTRPEDSFNELESLTLDAEKVLQALDLPYRVVELCTGDLGFSAARTYDIEVWFPSENKYREISSCSNFEDFQARRANIRFRRDPACRQAGQKSKPEFVHTLNGSGLAIGRTMAAIIENFQKSDGSFEIPPILSKFMQVS